MTPLLGLLLLAAAVFLWLEGLRARETALGIARRTCEREGCQLLDATVALRRLEPARNAEGRIVLRRTYVFEYSTHGGDRRTGFVILAGRRLLSVGL